MKRKAIAQLKPVFVLLSLGFSCTQTFAIPLAPGKVHHPIHYLPTKHHLLPSGLSPHQVRNAYGFNYLHSLGRGQTIAIIDAYDHPRIEEDLGVFDQQFGLPSCTSQNGCFKKLYGGQTRPATDPGWAGEIALDVEWAHAIAPRAKIMLVEATTADPADLDAAIQVAIQNGATVVSMSWGASEYPTQTEDDQLFNNPNISFVASSGDSGTGVNYPASSPYVLSVGGTSLKIDAYGNHQGESAWDGSSGGISTVEQWPSYQSGLPIPQSNNMRGVPDVSYNADPQTGFSVYDSIPGDDGAGWQVVGGTSAGAPQWAALIAIANAAVGKNVGGNINTLLYSYASPSSGLYHSLFHDVTTGTNGQCGFVCTAQSGYDYVTGLGSPDAVNIVHQMRQTPGLQAEG